MVGSLGLGLVPGHAVVMARLAPGDIEGLGPTHTVPCSGHGETDSVKIWWRKELLVKTGCEGRGPVVSQRGLKEVTDRGLRSSQGVPLLDVGLVMGDQGVAETMVTMEAVMIVSPGPVLGEVEHLVLVH